MTGELGPLTVFFMSDPTNHPSQNSDSKFNIKQGVFKQNPQALESTLISSTQLTKLVLRTLHFILKIQFKPSLLATISNAGYYFNHPCYNSESLLAANVTAFSNQPCWLLFQPSLL